MLGSYQIYYSDSNTYGLDATNVGPGGYSGNSANLTPTDGPSSSQLLYNETPYYASTKEFANFGILKVYAQSSLLDTLFENQMQTLAESSFVDYVTITSNTMPVNTPVSLEFNVNLDGSLFYNNGQLTPPAADSTSGITGFTYVHGNLLDNFNVTVGGTSDEARRDGSTIGFYNTEVGQTFQITSTLVATADSSSATYLTLQSGSPTNGVHGGTTIATSDYYDTANYYITSLTPGVTLTSASGHDYAMPAATTAVPEPSPLTLFGMGVFGLFGLTLRGKIRQRGAA